MSSETSFNQTLSAYLGGDLTAEQLVGAVSSLYYRDRGNGTRDALRPVMELIERAHPGVIELSGSEARPGFAVKLAERPFPKKLEHELRQAVEKALGTASTLPSSPIPRPGFLRRFVAAVRKLFRV